MDVLPCMQKHPRIGVFGVLGYSKPSTQAGVRRACKGQRLKLKVGQRLGAHVTCKRLGIPTCRG